MIFQTRSDAPRHIAAGDKTARRSLAHNVHGYKGLCPFDLAKGTIVPLETRVTAPQGGKKQGESPAQGGIFKGRCPLNGVYKGQRPLIMNSQSKPKGLRLYRLRR